MVDKKNKKSCPSCGACNWTLHRDLMGNYAQCSDCFLYLDSHDYDRQREKIDEYLDCNFTNQ